MARPRLAPRAQPARTLRRRLLVSLAAMLVPLVAVAAAGLVAHGRTSRAVEALGTQVVQETRALGAARDALYGLQVAVGRRAPREGRVREARRLVELRLAALGPFSEGQEHRLVRAVGDAMDDALDR